MDCSWNVSGGDTNRRCKSSILTSSSMPRLPCEFLQQKLEWQSLAQVRRRSCAPECSIPICFDGCSTTNQIAQPPARRRGSCWTSKAAQGAGPSQPRRQSSKNRSPASPRWESQPYGTLFPAHRFDKVALGILPRDHLKQRLDGLDKQISPLTSAKTMFQSVHLPKDKYARIGH